MAIIKTIKNLLGEVIYPVTKAKAVYMEDNRTVEDAINNIDVGDLPELDDVAFFNNDTGDTYEQVNPVNADLLEGHSASYFATAEEMTAVETEVSNLDNTVTTLNSAVNTINSNITSITGDINTIEGNITTIEGNINTINSNITSIENELNDIFGDTGVLPISKGGTGATTADDAFAALGINYGFPYAKTYDNTDLNTLTTNGFYFTSGPKGSANQYHIPDYVYNLIRSYYEFDLIVYGLGNRVSQIALFPYSGSAVLQGRIWSRTSAGNNGNSLTWTDWVEIVTSDNLPEMLASTKTVSNPNLLINGDFQVWQRGTSFEQRATANAYTADRWISGFINDAKTHEIAKDTDGSVKINPNSGYLSFCQVIENVGNLAGQEVTLSVMAKGNGTSGGTSDMQIFLYSGAFNFTNPFASAQNAQISNDNYEKKTITGTIPEGTESITVRVYVFKTNIINLKYVKLEIGSVATPLSPRPYAEELAMCQRYFLPITNPDSSNGTLGIGAYNSNGYIVLNMPIITSMRTKPTLSGAYTGNRLRLYYAPTAYEQVSNAEVLDYSAAFVTLALTPSGSNIPTNENRAINVVYASNGHFYLDAEIYP